MAQTDLASLAVSVTNKGVKESTAGLKDLEKQSAKTEQSVGQLGSSTNTLSTSLSNLSKIATGAFVGFKVGQYAKDALLLAARYETMNVVLETTGKNAGYAQYEMLAFEQQLQKNGIAMQEARVTLTKLAAAQIDLADSAELSRVAQNAAVIAGINSSEAFDRLTYGIVSAQTEVLRTIGINVNFEQSYRSLAKQLGKTMDDLTAEEKTQERVNAVLRAGTHIMGAYEKSMETAGKQLTSMPRYLQNIQTTLGEVGLDSFSYAILGVTDVLVDLEGKLRELSDSGDLKEFSESAAVGFEFLVSNVDNAVVAYGSYLAIRKLVTAETTQAFLADTKMHGALNTILDRVPLITNAQRDRLLAEQALYKQELANLTLQKQANASLLANAQVKASSALTTRQVSASTALLNQAQAQNITITNAMTVAQNKLNFTTLALSRSTTVLGGIMGLVRGAGSGLISMMGGPWVAALTAVATATYTLWNLHKKEEEQLEKSRKAYEKYKNTILEDSDKIANITEKERLALLKQTESQLVSLTTQYDGFISKLSSGETQGFLSFMSPQTRIATEKAIESVYNQYGALIQQAQTAEERINLANQAIAELELKDTGELDTDMIERAKALYGEVVIILSRIADKQDQVNNLSAKHNSNLREQKDILKANENEWKKFTDAFAKYDATNVVNSLETSVEFIKDYVKETEYGVQKQKDLTQANIETVRAMYQQRIELARVSGEYDKMGIYVKLLAELNAAVLSGPKISKGDVSNIDSALESLERFRTEIAEMQGQDVSGLELAESLRDIEKTAKEAGKSSKYIKDFQKAYTDAFNAERNREIQEEILGIESSIARMFGQENKADALEFESEIVEMRNSLNLLGVESSVVEDLITRFIQASDFSKTNEQLSNASSFMKDLENITGVTGLAIDSTNKYLESQATLLREQLGPAYDEYINKWLYTQKQMEQHNSIEHIRKSYNDWITEASSVTESLGETLKTTFDSASDTLTEFALTGKADFNSLANSIISDLMRIAIQKSISGIFEGVTSLFDFGSSSLMEGGASFVGPLLPSAKGNVFSGGNLSSYSGSVVSSPTMFGYGSHYKKFAKGAGLMGEAGPEAIMPLTRTSNGDLGVSVDMNKGGGSTIIVNQTINFTTPTTTGTSQNQTTETDYQKIAKMIKSETEATVINVLAKQSRSGGMLRGGV